jgi:hypothetical protein
MTRNTAVIDAFVYAAVSEHGSPALSRQGVYFLCRGLSPREVDAALDRLERGLLVAFATDPEGGVSVDVRRA